MTSDSSSSIPPSVLWAQSNNSLFLTVCVEDCKDPTIKIDDKNVYFKGLGGPDKREFEINIDTFEPIIPDKSAHKVSGRNIEFCLQKEKEGPFWPRLTKDSKKHHWLKIDFNKWHDEDDSEDEGMGGMGGMPGMGGMGGMPGMGGMGGMPGMGGMGGMPGMGGMGGMPGMGGFGGGDQDFEEMMKNLGGLGQGGMGDKPNLDDLDKEEDSDDEDPADLPDLE